MQKTFPNTGDDFSGLDAATNWLRDNGYIWGSLQRDDPVVILKEDFASGISKWKYLSKEERQSLHGQIEAGDKRRGDVVVTIKE